MVDDVLILEAKPDDAGEIARIHIDARREAMPDLARAHTDAETLAWFATVVGDRPSAWWVARLQGRIVGYLRLDRDGIDHLYVLPAWQGRGVGTMLLEKAKALRPDGLALFTFQKNTKARAFYESHGFRAVGFTDGQNEENEPDIRYVWGASE
jgi:ribosomal protein S18 acetylase RimI-like enzyme